jgi:hypothetical protein
LSDIGDRVHSLRQRLKGRESLSSNRPNCFVDQTKK